MRGLLNGRTVLLAGPLDDVGDLIALPLAAAGAAVVFAGPCDHFSRQLAAKIHRAGGIVSSAEVQGRDCGTLAGPVDLMIKIWPSYDAAGSTADCNEDPLTSSPIVERRSASTIEVCRPPSSDGEARPVRWTIQHRETLPHADAGPTVTPVHGVDVRTPAAVAGEVLLWVLDALLPSVAAPTPTHARAAEDILWDEEARADEDLNFELA